MSPNTSGGTVNVSIPSGDAATLESLANQLDKHAGDLATLGQSITSTTGGIRSRAGWSGDAADAYTTFCSGVSTSVQAMPAPLHQVASAIRTYAATLSQQQQSVEDAVHSANNTKGSGNAAAVSKAESTSKSAATAVSGAADKAKGETEDAKSVLDTIMEKTEPVRKWLEIVHLPWDMGGGAAFELGPMKNAEEAEKAAKAFMKGLPDLEKEWFGSVNSLAHDADNGAASWDDVASEWARYSSKVDAAEAFGKQGVEATEALASKLKWLGRGMGVLGLIGDTATLIKPPDSGARGTVDRVAAGINLGTTAFSLAASTEAGGSFLAGLAGANALDEVPVVGEVVMAADVGTGLYMAGDYIYDHWDGISHGAEHIASDVGHGIASGVKKVLSWL